ncbi:response regulator [Marinobacter salinisoli]|uniref:histidine kinase n=2 Tax=Marinobacter salinisoli TaxID=2769486 RepID=A0ABX7MZJ9_9GAMM|nr:response regulator [Marinobacter salinisoli]
MALGLILNLIQINLEYFKARDSMEEEIHALIDISISPASQIAYNIDITLANELLDGLLKHPAIIDARIIDNEGFTMAASTRSSPDSPYRWASDFLFEDIRGFSQELLTPQHDDLDLGRLILTIDTYHYGIQFLERATYTLISGLLKSLALSAALLAIFFLVLTRPLLNVIGVLSKVDTDSPERTRLPVPKGHEEDEIGTLVDIINQHLDAIDSSLAQLRTAEIVMKDYSNELEHEVRDRTREISEKNEALQRGNRALVKAKEDAVQRARARANFLANMSHEIRTPLNGLLGMLALTLKGDLEAGQRERLDIALTAGESLLSLLNDILDISKVEAGKLNLENIPFSPRGLIEEAAALHAQQAHEKQIELVCSIDPNLPEHLIGDPTRVRQVLNNLLNNAVKFTDQGSVQIQASHARGSLTLDIRDTGIGISEDSLDRIFSAFSQADAETTRLYGGTGLGLTLCQQLVERMHGRIQVESQQGQGTHFQVSLPLAIHGPHTPHELPDSAARLRELGVTLAIPEANPHRRPIERQLQAWGIPVQDVRQSKQGVLIALIAEGYSGGMTIAKHWKGKGVVLADRLGTHASVLADAAILNLPLRRDELLRCLCHATGLPWHEPDEPGSSEAESPAAAPSLDILLVEDNRVNQLVAANILKGLGHRVVPAQNGREAIDALNAKRYDLVLMDCQMPVMDGYEATRKIRQNPEWKDLPIVAVTANVMDGDKEACLACGMDDYLTKPYNRARLQEIVNRWAPASPAISEHP